MAARIRSDAADFIFKNYLADSIYYYARGQATNVRYSDLLNSKKKPEDKRTPEQIVDDVIHDAGLEVRN